MEIIELNEKKTYHFKDLKYGEFFIDPKDEGFLYLKIIPNSDLENCFELRGRTYYTKIYNTEVIPIEIKK